MYIYNPDTFLRITGIRVFFALDNHHRNRFIDIVVQYRLLSVRFTCEQALKILKQWATACFVRDSPVFVTVIDFLQFVIDFGGYWIADDLFMNDHIRAVQKRLFRLDEFFFYIHIGHFPVFFSSKRLYLLTYYTRFIFVRL